MTTLCKTWYKPWTLHPQVKIHIATADLKDWNDFRLINLSGMQLQ